MTMSAMVSNDEALIADPAAGPDLRGSWYEIDLGAIRHNYRELRDTLPATVKIYACLKRNAYGCGADTVARALAEEGADGFAVASLLDAMAIRRCGVQSPILLYPGAPIKAAAVIDALGLTVSISSLDELDLWRRALPTIRVFLKVDLGFFRAGATPRQAGSLMAAVSAAAGVHVEGLYAHISELPTSTPADVIRQFNRMQTILSAATSEGNRPPLVMMSSTEGVLNHPEMDLDAVDPGALFVGLTEGRSPVRRLTLRPALKAIVTHLVAVKRIDPSLGPLPSGLGFREDMMLGVVGFGWGDGFPREVPSGASALVGGLRVPILRPAHLEHLRLDLTRVPDARVGDPVILLGRQGDEEIPLAEVASLWNTDAVGLYASLRDHVPRLYL